MKKRTIIFVLSLSALLNINLAFGQNHTIIELGSGISKSVGDGSEYWNVGLNINWELFQKVSENLLFGGRFAYNRLSPNEDELKKEFNGNSDIDLDVSGSASIIELLPSIRIVSSKNQNQKIQFVGQIGVGCHILKRKTEISSAGLHLMTEIFEIEFGTNFGGGIIMGISENAKLSIYPMYNIIFTEEESTKYFALNIGISFGN